jgi:DNA (cytosine-5)-methyltransferase 1
MGATHQVVSSRKKLTAISLYTGAGGLDLGFEAAGFETRVAVEMDDDCVATLQANRSWPVMHRSIHEISSQDMLSVAGLASGEADVLIGGPPCQPFSKCGYWVNGDAARLDDPRATTVEAFLRVLRDTRPRAFLMENVAGLAFKGKDEGLRLVEQTVAAVNREQGTRYAIELLVLNAADFGVPQIRERAFLIGARDGTRFGALAPTHRPLANGNGRGQLELDLLLPPYRTAWDALGDLEESGDPEGLRVRGKWADLLPSIPEGQNYLFHTERGGGLALFGWRRRFWNFLLKLAKDQPSWTLTAQPGPATGPFHWKSRRLSARELCRLQTMPDDYQVLGSLGAVQRQVGNAVPSALAEVIALQIRARLLGDRSAEKMEPTLVPPRRSDLLPPEPVRRVPKKYHALVGEHAAHPGTGKGNRAAQRASAG